jgi:hypothetical protein
MINAFVKIQLPTGYSFFLVDKLYMYGIYVFLWIQMK